MTLFARAIEAALREKGNSDESPKRLHALPSPQAHRARDTTKVRRGQANNSIRCTRYEQPAWDAIGGCKRSKEAALETARAA